MSKTTSRRAILAGIAAAPAMTAVPALALPAEPDPIFAAIEEHRAACKVYYATSLEHSRVHDVGPDFTWKEEPFRSIRDRDNAAQEASLAAAAKHRRRTA